MKRGLKSAVVAVLAGLIFGAAGLSPADADTAGTLTSPGQGVLYPGCHDVLVPYSLNLPAGTDYWDLDITTVRPDGTAGPETYLYNDGSTDSDPRAGDAPLSFCDSQMPGTYTISATGQTENQEVANSRQPFTLSPTTFAMRSPTSRTSINKAVRRGQTHLHVTVTDERPAGYFATDDATVRLQERDKEGRWQTVPHTKGLTDSHGRYTYNLSKLHLTAKVRIATSEQDGGYTASKSKPVTLH